MFKLSLYRHAEVSVSEMQKLMEERKDIKSMRLPRSFANIQSQIFPDTDEASEANKALHSDGNSAALHCRR